MPNPEKSPPPPRNPQRHTPPEGPPPPRLREHQSSRVTEQTKTPDRKQRLSKIGRGVVATGTSLVVAGGAFFGIDAIRSSDDSLDGHTPAPVSPTETVDQKDTPEVELPVEDLTEITSQPSKELRESFVASVETSKCDTPETALRAAEVHHQVFEAISYEDATLEELKLASENLIANIEEARSKLEFGDLPEAYHQLASDILSGEPSLPLELYGSALNEIGINASYDWPAPDFATNNNVPLPHEAVPMDPADTATSTPLRRAMFATINSYATLPTEVIDMADENLKFYFGDIVTDHDAAGHAATVEGWAPDIPDAHRIVIDTATDWSEVSRDHRYESSLLHEIKHIEHRQQLAICGAVLDHAFVNQYPEGFTPSEEMEQKLASNLVTEEGYTTIHGANTAAYSGEALPDNATIVAARPYGALSVGEAQATLVGEYLFDTHESYQLFNVPDELSQHLDPVYRQLSLQVARFENFSPEVSDFYLKVLQIANLEMHLFKLSNRPTNAAEYDEVSQMMINLSNAQIGLPRTNN